MTTAILTAGSSLWYLSRGSGVVTLLLLTTLAGPRHPHVDAVVGRVHPPVRHRRPPPQRVAAEPRVPRHPRGERGHRRLRADRLARRLHPVRLALPTDLAGARGGGHRPAARGRHQQRPAAPHLVPHLAPHPPVRVPVLAHRRGARPRQRHRRRQALAARGARGQRRDVAVPARLAGGARARALDARPAASPSGARSSRRCCSWRGPSAAPCSPAGRTGQARPRPSSTGWRHTTTTAGSATGGTATTSGAATGSATSTGAFNATFSGSITQTGGTVQATAPLGGGASGSVSLLLRGPATGIRRDRAARRPGQR